MCNLYRMTKTVDEIARLFEADVAAGSNAGGEVYPGYPGVVVAEGRVQTMHWGFPLAARGKSGQLLKPRPINNARTDKLSSPFWKASFVSRRCLIPLEAFAEAEGPKGGKTRTWVTVPGEETFTVAGIWRWSEEWGEVYSMVMTEACVDMDGLHDRMPVIVASADRAAWTNASPEEAFAVCRPWPGALALDRTAEPWAGRR
nr:SOS response-associated peptidase family protein [Croceibacterium sp. D39]